MLGKGALVFYKQLYFFVIVHKANISIAPKLMDIQYFVCICAIYCKIIYFRGFNISWFYFQKLIRGHLILLFSDFQFNKNFVFLFGFHVYWSNTE